MTLSVEVSEETKPTWWHVGYFILLPHIRAFRAFILYYRLPYDLPIWSKIRDPWYYIMLFIGANPNVVIRGGFFTIYLACIAAELEEFQVKHRRLCSAASRASTADPLSTVDSLSHSGHPFHRGLPFPQRTPYSPAEPPLPPPPPPFR